MQALEHLGGPLHLQRAAPGPWESRAYVHWSRVPQASQPPRAAVALAGQPAPTVYELRTVVGPQLASDGTVVQNVLWAGYVAAGYWED